jgi:hypothetical protein
MMSTDANNTQYTWVWPVKLLSRKRLIFIGLQRKAIADTLLQDKLYIGISLDSHFTDFRLHLYFVRENNNPLDANYKVTRLQFNNDLYTYGTGFHFKWVRLQKSVSRG